MEFTNLLRPFVNFNSESSATADGDGRTP
jgi:hypothetical protein